jgi:hypothetical protein
MVFVLAAQAAEDRAYFEQFKAAAAYITQHGKVPADRFILSFWRGEWSECYA